MLMNLYLFCVYKNPSILAQNVQTSCFVNHSSFSDKIDVRMIIHTLNVKSINSNILKVKSINSNTLMTMTGNPVN